VADILGIGASGLSAYRKSLEVTGNNIVNAGTEGYARRTATLASSGERASSPTSISQGGGGVGVVGEVREGGDEGGVEEARVPAEIPQVVTRLGPHLTNGTFSET
jgi:flagellar hook-associated protein 1 FlgK